MPQKKLTQLFVDRVKPPKSGRVEYFDQPPCGLHLRVMASGAKTWALFYRTRAGQQKRYTIGPLSRALGVKEAHARTKTLLDEIAGGGDPALKKRQDRAAGISVDGARTFGALADRWLESDVKPNTRPSTYVETKRIFDKDLKLAWGTRPIEAITRADVSELLDNIIRGKGRKERRKPAPVQANRVQARLKRFFNWCVDKSVLAASPIAGMKAKTKEYDRERVLTDEEIRQFWEACGELDRPFGPLNKLLLLTAQRLDEVAGMRWSELDLEGKTWTIPGERAKNHRTHEVQLSAQALAILTDPDFPRFDGVDFVFTTNRKTAVSGFSRAKDRLDVLMTRVLEKSIEARPDQALQPSAAKGSRIQITVKGREPFKTADVHRVVAIRHDKGWGYARITEVISPKVIEARTLVPFKAAAASGVWFFGPEAWIVHDLRRSAASGMARLKMPEHVVDKLLNHVSGKIRGVAAIYNRYDYLDDRRTALEAWGAYVARLTGQVDTANVEDLRKAS